MSHYKKDAASNRDALFGGGGGGGGGGTNKRGGGAPRISTQQQKQRPTATAAASRSNTATATAAAASKTPAPTNYGFTPSTTASLSSTDATITPGPSIIFASHGRSAARSNSPMSLLTGQAKITKMAEAEDYRLKAKKAMTRGIFSKPDPISAANYYKRAADAYKACGENRLERLHRIASGDCQLGQDAYATAAAEYTRAAELAETSDETLPRKRQECHKLHLDAASAWTQMGERGRSAESTMKAAFGLIMGTDTKKAMDSKALKSVEEAIETYVPDPLNRKANYRRTGVSAYRDPNTSDDTAANANATTTNNNLELAKQNIITDAFAHETLFKVSNELIKRRHYESALYAHGAGTATLEHEGFATISLFRAYVSTTIITLAMGDTVAASRDFQRVHLQNTQYLSSRECALEEDLIRACDAMDEEALEEVRSKSGSHRGGMANLDLTVRELVGEIRVSGRIKKKKPSATPKQSVPTPTQQPVKQQQPPKQKELSGKELTQDTDAGFDEMDDIMNQMGLNEDDDDDDDDDDDEIDLT